MEAISQSQRPITDGEGNYFLIKLIFFSNETYKNLDSKTRYHYLIQKMDALADMAGDLVAPQEFDLGSLIGSMIQRNMGLNNSENVYGRNERGEFDGTQEIIETTHLPPEELLESDRNG